MTATKDIKLSGINEESVALIQAVTDNFDADKSSPDGKVTTHALAMLTTQPTNAADDNYILGIWKSEMSKEIDFESPVQRSQGNTNAGDLF